MRCLVPLCPVCGHPVGLVSAAAEHRQAAQAAAAEWVERGYRVVLQDVDFAAFVRECCAINARHGERRTSVDRRKR